MSGSKFAASRLDASCKPNMSSEIQQFIEKCDVCKSYDKSKTNEILISHDVQDRP